MKTLQKILYAGLIASSLAVIGGCSLSSKNQEKEVVDLNSNTHVLTKSQTDQISGHFDYQKSNEIHFLNPMNLHAGEMIVSGPSAGIGPEKIIRVSPDRKTIYVQKIPLEQMINSADIKNLDITPPSGYLIETTKEGTKKIPYKHGSLNLNHEFKNIVLYRDSQGHPLVVNGNFDLWSDLFLNAQIRKRSLETLTLGDDSKLNLNLRISAPSPIVANSSYGIKFVSPPYPVMVGGIPVDVQAFIDVILKARGKFSGMNELVTHTNNLNGKIFYENGHWSKERTFSSKSKLNPYPIKFNVKEGSVSLTINGGFYVYGTLGPYVGLTEGVDFQGNTQNSPWKILVDSEGHAGIDMGWLSRVVRSYQDTLVKRSEVLAQGETSHSRIDYNNKVNLGDYFLKGNELKGLEIISSERDILMRDYLIPLIPNSFFSQRDEVLKLPYFFSSKELSKLAKDNTLYKNLNQLGVSLYIFKDNMKHGFSQETYHFNTEKDAWNFFGSWIENEKRGASAYSDVPLYFLFKNKDTFSVVSGETFWGNQNLGGGFSPNENITYLYDLGKYQKRTSSSVYQLKNESQEWRWINVQNEFNNAVQKIDRQRDSH